MNMQPACLAVAVVFVCVSMKPLGAEEKEKGIACKTHTEHHMNSGSIYLWLEIAGPEKKAWKFTSKDEIFLFERKGPHIRQMSGTYEIEDDLAVFTGKSDVDENGKLAEREIRFAVNHGRVGGRVEFNKFFPTSDGKMRLHRKWYTRRGKEWALLEERSMSFPANSIKKGEGVLEVPLSAERICWDESGKKTSQKYSGTITWAMADHGQYYWHKTPSAPEWVRGDVRTHFVNGQLESLSFEGGMNVVGFYLGIANISQYGVP